MKRTKRILSAVTALAITASAFASMVIPASAEDTVVYTAAIKDITTSPALYVKMTTTDSASDTDKVSVPNYKTGTTEETSGKYAVAAVPALAGWGYKHVNGDITGNAARQTGVSIDKTANAITAEGSGGAGAGGAVSFIPANADLTLGNNIYTYTFDAIVTTTANSSSNGEGSTAFGFTKAADGAAVTADTSVGKVDLAATGTPNVANKYKLVLVDDKSGAEETYKIYQDGVLKASGTAEDGITGIYTSTIAKFINTGIGNLVLTQVDAAPTEINSVTFMNGDTEFAKYEHVLANSTVTPPATDPAVSGKVFVGWKLQGTEDSAVLETLTAGATNTVFEAVFQDRAAITEDYETGNVDWTSSNTSRYTATIAEDNGNHYMKIANVGSNNATDVKTNSNCKIKINAGEDFFLTMKMQFNYSNNQVPTYTINAADGYIFKLEQIASGSGKYRINGYDGQTVELAKDTWYTVNIARKGTTTFLQIKNPSGEEVFAQAPIYNRSTGGGITGMIFTTGRYDATMALDDITLRGLQSSDVPDVSYYNYNIKTSRYANMTYKLNDGVELKEYADVNGNIVIPNLPNGTKMDYTLTKNLWSTATGSGTIDGADITDTKPLESQLSAEDADYIYVESDFGNAQGAAGLDAGGRDSTIALGDVEVPDMTTVSIDWYVEKAEKDQVTWFLKNKAGKIIVGLQGKNAPDDITPPSLTAFTKWATSTYNQYNSTFEPDNSMIINEGYVGDITVDFVIDNVNNIITITCGDTVESINLEEDVDPTTISTMEMHKSTTQTQAKIKEVRISKPNENYVGIVGDKTIGKIKGKTVTRQMKATPAAIVPGEVFTWTVKDESGNDVTGVTIDENGLLSVADTAPEGKVIVKAVSNAKEEGAKNGTAEITIGGFQNYNMTLDGPKAYELADKATEKGQYSVKSAIDALGDDVKDVADVVWSTEDANVATINEDGELTIVGAGKTTVKATITNDDKVSTAEIPVTVAKYSILADASGDTTTVDTTDIISEGVKEYTIVTSKEGKQVSATTKAVADMPTTKKTASVVPVDAVMVTATYTADGTLASLSSPEKIPANTQMDAIPESTATEKTFLWDSLDGMKPVTIETKEIDVPGGNLEIASTGADKVEVIPVFETTSTASADTRYTFEVPKDTYNITVTMTGDRADVYVNDQMLVNNMLQYGNTPDTEVRHDIYVKEGYAAINTTDYGSNAGACTMSKITLTKAPESVTRVPKVYVLGDSLVAKYYNGGSAESNVQTGWGQVLENYIKDTYEVVPLANSGVRASGLAKTAITQVAESGEAGDIMILESGYNDKTENKEALFKASMKKMYDTAADKDIDVILVSPNASMHDYSASVAWTEKMAALVAEGGECEGAKYIDLSALSYAFLSTTYASDGDNAFAKEVNKTPVIWPHYNVSDKLHSTYDAAQKWASIVASKMLDLGYTDVVDTTYTYTFTDTATPANTITCKAVASE